MDKQDWKTAHAAVVAIEAERAALVEHLVAEQKRILGPTRLRYEIAMAKLDEIEGELGAPIHHCEGCSEPIFEGDKYHAGMDCALCFECAPTYGDMQAHPDNFCGADDETLTQAEADEIVSGHLAAGGSLEDKRASA